MLKGGERKVREDVGTGEGEGDKWSEGRRGEKREKEGKKGEKRGNI